MIGNVFKHLEISTNGYIYTCFFQSSTKWAQMNLIVFVWWRNWNNPQNIKTLIHTVCVPEKSYHNFDTMLLKK